VDTRSFNSGISDLDDYKIIAYGNKDVYDSHRQYWIDQNGQRNDKS
jgi:hypothetical protein